MVKTIKNNKGFTLIELLAVIVILGILMIVAIPQVTRYIEQSKRDAYIDNAKAYINAARYAYLNDEFSNTTGCGLGENARIPITKLAVDNSGKSPFGGVIEGFVTIISEEIDNSSKPDDVIYKYSYYITLKDKNTAWGVNGKEADIKRRDVIKVDWGLTDVGSGYTNKDVVCGASIEVFNPQKS